MGAAVPVWRQGATGRTAGGLMGADGELEQIVSKEMQRRQRRYVIVLPLACATDSMTSKKKVTIAYIVFSRGGRMKSNRDSARRARLKRLARQEELEKEVSIAAVELLRSNKVVTC